MVFSAAVLRSSGSLQGVQQSATDVGDGAEGGALWERLDEVPPTLQTAAEQRVQRHAAWNTGGGGPS